MRRAIFLLVAGCSAWAQTPLAFEVATIKPTNPEWRGGRFIRMESTHRFIARNHALKTLIAAAYNISPRAILGGPVWLDSDRYDIQAMAPGETRPSLDEQMTMLRALLADRFQLAFHREPQEMPVFRLTIAKGGPKLKPAVAPKESSPTGPSPLIFMVSPQLVELPAKQASMADLASVFQRSALDRPVLDETKLAGLFDFDLEFAPDEGVFGGVLGRGPESPTRPGLMTAIQEQLGLKLEAARGTVQTLVIDRLERPSAN
jgi:uncharacterized protein (TIGR03435 family)